MAAPCIDSHQHFWHYSPSEHTWMDDRMSVLKRDYLPGDLQPLLGQAGFDGCVAVQARQSLEETRWLLGLADAYPFIRGVVGWVDLRSEGLAAQLDEFCRHPKLVGVRHVVHDEPDDQFMMGEAFRRGIAQLAARELVYDLLLFPRHLPVALRLAEEFPAQDFVLDHISKPPIASGETRGWAEDLRALARHPRVSCKLSGMVTEARWGAWQPADFHRYLDIVLEAFGTERVMIGSDWPVCLLSGDYLSVVRIVTDWAGRLPAAQRDAVLGGNCARIYRL